MEAVGATMSRTKSKAPVKRVSWVSRSGAAKPDCRLNDRRRGDGDVVKFCVLTQGDLSASAVLAVVVTETR